VDVNFAGFLGVVADNLATIIGAIHCFTIKFSDTVSLHTVLNIPANPASTQKVPMALYDCFRATRPLSGHGRFLPDDE
jgi:hypothetical protein